MEADRKPISICMYADVYGFSALVANDLDQTCSLLTELHNWLAARLPELNKNAGIDKPTTSIISDNVFLSTPVRSVGDFKKDFETFCRLAAELHLQSLRHGLPLRGCITIGHIIHHHNVLLGNPIIRAAEIEKQIRLPIVFLPLEEVERARQHFGLQDDRRWPESCGPVIDIDTDNGLLAGQVIAVRDAATCEYAKEMYEKSRRVSKLQKVARTWKTLHTLFEETLACGD